DVAVVKEPIGRPSMQGRYLVGHRPAQLEPQEVGEELVETEPGAPGIQRDDEGIGVLELQQDALGARLPAEQVGQLPVHPIEEGGAYEQVPYLGRLGVEHLGDQVLGDRSVTSGELPHE